MTFTELEERVLTARQYRNLRAIHPDYPARTVLAWLKHGDGESIKEFACPGHDWAYTSDVENEGRCYCLNCGKDGDG